MKKRGILSGLAKVYDPLGVVSPVMVVAGKIFQDVCNQGTSWDSPVPRNSRKMEYISSSCKEMA